MGISKETSSTSSIPPSPSPAAESLHADARPERSWLAALLALLLGAGCGALQVTLADLSSTALAVTALSMTMGCAWPRRPWRWALIVGLCVPAAVFLDW